MANDELEQEQQSNGGGMLIQLDSNAVSLAKQWYDNFRKYVKEVLVEGVDYGKVAGMGNKPSLLKPGAEKLRLVFGLQVDFTRSSETMDVEKDFYDVNYICTIKDNAGRVIGQCEGSAGTYEDKYARRRVPCKPWTEPSKEEKEILKARKLGRNSQINNVRYRMVKEANEGKLSLKNTIQKIAQKRAYVGAILIATGGSELFTQDIEDLAGTVIDATHDSAPTSAPATSITSTAPTGNTANPANKISDKQKAMIQGQPAKLWFTEKAEWIIEKMIAKHAPGKTLDTLNSLEASTIIGRMFSKANVLEDTGIGQATKPATPAPAQAVDKPTPVPYDDNEDLPF